MIFSMPLMPSFSRLRDVMRRYLRLGPAELRHTFFFLLHRQNTAAYDLTGEHLRAN
jgi:hypothetical protein